MSRRRRCRSRPRRGSCGISSCSARSRTAELKSSLTTLLGTAPADPLGTVFGSSLSTTLFTKLFDGVATRQSAACRPTRRAARRRCDYLQCELQLHACIDRAGLQHHHRGLAVDAEPARLHGARRRPSARRRRRSTRTSWPMSARTRSCSTRRAARSAIRQRPRPSPSPASIPRIADAGAEGIARHGRSRSAHRRRGHGPDDPCHDLYGQPVAAEPRRRRQPDRDLGQGADEYLSRQQEQPRARRRHRELRPDHSRAGQRHRGDRPRRRQARRRQQHLRQCGRGA